MNTDLLASDRRVDKIALVQTRGTSFTSSEEEYRSVPIARETPDAGYLPLPVFHTLRSSTLHSAVTIAVSHYEVIQPAPATVGGPEAAAYFFAKRVGRVPAVFAVTYSTEGDTHLIWTFIHQRDKTVRRSVYQEELRLMDAFPDLTFDFNVIAADQAETRSLLPDDLQGRIVLYRQ